MTTVNTLEDARPFAPPPEAKPRTELGQDDFLKLMITQFQNQDPFKPMENGEFLGQLAQFSTVSGIDSLNTSFSGLAGSIQDEQALQAANLVGRSVLAVTDIGYLAEDGLVNGAVEIDGAVSNVQIEITNSTGEVVQRLAVLAHRHAQHHEAGLGDHLGRIGADLRQPAGKHLLHLAVDRLQLHLGLARPLLRLAGEEVDGEAGA